MSCQGYGKGVVSFSLHFCLLSFSCFTCSSVYFLSGPFACSMHTPLSYPHSRLPTSIYTIKFLFSFSSWLVYLLVFKVPYMSFQQGYLLLLWFLCTVLVRPPTGVSIWWVQEVKVEWLLIAPMQALVWNLDHKPCTPRQCSI